MRPRARLGADALVEYALVVFLGRSSNVQRAVGADARADLDDVGVDLGCARGRAPPTRGVAVAHEVDLADLVERDRRHRLAAAHGVGDPLPARAHARRGGRNWRSKPFARSTVPRIESSGTSAADVGLLEVTERRDHLVVGQDDVDVAGSRPTRRARRDST